MGQNKEIGEVFASKLKDAKKSPSKELWQRVDNSLVKQGKIKNRIYWFVSGSILLIGVFLIFEVNVSNDNPHYTEENFPLENETILPIEHYQDREEDENETVEPNRITLDNKNSNPKAENVVNKIEDETQKEIEDDLKSKNNKSLKTESIDNTYEVKKNYYYYNSEDGKNIVTENIEIIDSLVNKKQQETDSLPENNNNLLGL